MKVTFNPNEVEQHNVEPVNTDDIVNTFGLFNASPEDAFKYGSPAIKHVLEEMELLWKNDRKYITVDAKVHMLFPKMSPAIPGWHTDGVPRMYEPGKYSVHKGVPDYEYLKSGEWRPHRYWLYNSSLVGCPTFFANEELTLNIDNHDTGVYGKVDKHLGDAVDEYPTFNDTVYEFDWLNLHRVKPATRREWRLLVRVVESDYFEPQTDPDSFIRYQQQVYIQKGFGW